MTSSGDSGPPQDDDDADQRRSLAALLFIAVLVALLVWLVNLFQSSNQKIQCIEAGHHDCAPLDTSAKTP